MAGVNTWSLAGLGVILALVPCGAAVLKGTAAQRLAALGLAQILTVSALLLLAMAGGDFACLDLALTASFLTLPAGLVLAHFLGRWL
jgi:multisubunit Na+/H+ antiporter MnhF subunit